MRTKESDRTARIIPLPLRAAITPNGLFLAASVSVMSVVSSGCGSAPPAQPEPATPVAVAPVQPNLTVVTPPPPPSTARPANVAGWLHIESPKALLPLAGFDPANPDMVLSVVASAFDLSRPIDVGLTYSAGDDIGIAAVIPLVDQEKALAFLASGYDVKQDGAHYLFTKKSDGNAEAAKKPALECEIKSSPLLAICGMPGSVAPLVPWLTSGLATKRGDVALEMYVNPMRETMTRGLNAFDPTPAKGTDAPERSASDRAFTDAALAFVSELDQYNVSLSIKGSTLTLESSVDLKATESPWSKILFAPVAQNDKSPLLFRLTDSASAAAVLSGSGPLLEIWKTFEPIWLDQRDPKDSPAKAKSMHDGIVIFDEAVRTYLAKPWGVSYAIDLPRVKKTVAELKTAKDPDKAKLALAKAIDGYVVIALSSDIASIEARTRKLVAVDPPQEASTLRAAGNGLPKGSFFIDDPKKDASGKASKKLGRKPIALLVSDGTFTYVIVDLSEDAAFVSAAKDFLARKPAAHAIDPLLQQDGVIFGGQFTSQTGAFGAHEYMLTAPGKMDAAERAHIVEDLEHDLAEPELPIPFAFSARKSGARGVLAWDVKGDRAAFMTLYKHLNDGKGPLDGVLGGGSKPAR